MIQNYGDLEPGQEISRHRFELDDDVVDEYVAAVQDASVASTDSADSRLVPAMAVAALSVRGVIQGLGIPGGSLHVGQEFQFSAPVRIGDALESVATLAQNSLRRDWRVLIVDCQVRNQSQVEVLVGKSTIMIPENVGPSEVA